MYFSQIFAALLLCGTATAQAQITLNEFLSSNNAVNQNPEFQAFSDWGELHNSSNADVDLTAWRLSDDADVLDKWSFPHN